MGRRTTNPSSGSASATAGVTPIVFSRATGQPQLITNFAGDVIQEVAVDDKNGWFYFVASPDNPTQTFLYRSRLDGTGTPNASRLPIDTGTHFYDLSPNGEWAFHIHSSFTHPPVTELVHLPDHKTVRVLQTNEELAQEDEGPPLPAR